uniref:BEN domain-containing protein 5 n=1 Tax=Geotrypetes seraphini TaxID=260995 RepID=A0A6P8NLE7_GEOSA|nr:BEN domain-containing protein 5 isoform X2 [Geotrypetes seraphini]
MLALKVRVIFNIVNFSKTKSLYRDGMAPMVKSTSRPKWQRLPAKNVYYYRCPDHRKNYVMSFAFCFDREDDIYQFAYCYPYTYTRLQHYLDNLEKKNMEFVGRELLGLSVQQRRLDLMTITNPQDTGEFKDDEEEEMELRHSKRQDGRKQHEGTHKSIEAVVARLEKQNGRSQNTNCSSEEAFMETSENMNMVDNANDPVVPRVEYEELLRSYQQQQEEMRHIQQELERTRRQLVQQAKKLKEYGTLVSEVKELRDLNRRLQDVLLLRLDSAGLGFEIQRARKQPETTVQRLEIAWENKTAEVHLGSEIWVDAEKWHQVQVTQGDSKFTKNLAVMIWGTDVLKNRSVTGVATKKKKDAVPKPPLSPHKLSIVRECLYDRIAQDTMDETEIAQRLSKVNKYICEKIMDINKSCKNEERREAKYSMQ